MRTRLSNSVASRALASFVFVFMLVGGAFWTGPSALASGAGFDNTLSVSGSGVCSGVAVGNSVPVTFSITRQSAAGDPIEEQFVTGGTSVVVGATSWSIPRTELSLGVNETGSVTRSYPLTAEEAAELASSGIVTIPVTAMMLLLTLETLPPYSQSGSGSLVITGCQEATATPTESPTEVPTVVPTEVPTIVPTETPTIDPEATVDPCTDDQVGAGGENPSETVCSPPTQPSATEVATEEPAETPGKPSDEPSEPVVMLPSTGQGSQTESDRLTGLALVAGAALVAAAGLALNRRKQAN
jgi:hypothetical protein